MLVYSLIKMVRNFFKKRKKKKSEKQALYVRIAFVLGGVLILLLIVAGIYYGTRVTSLQIKNVTVSGGVTVSQESVGEVVWDELDNTHLYLIPNTFKPLYPKEEIEKKLVGENRIKSAEVDLVNSGTLHVTFEEYRPYALWCSEDGTQGCMFIDEYGFAYARAPELVGTALVRYYTQADRVLESQDAFDYSFIEYTKTFIFLLSEEFSWSVASVYKYEPDDIEYHLAQGGIIKVSQNIASEENIENLRFILDSPDFNTLQPGSFSYIDLRFGEKVFINDTVGTDEIATSSQEAI